MAAKKRPSKRARVRKKEPKVRRDLMVHGIVSYVGNDEVLVCRPEMEENMLACWFYEDSGRRRLDYDRYFHVTGIVQVKSKGFSVA